jgi:hypothetical protein
MSQAGVRFANGQCTLRKFHLSVDTPCCPAHPSETTRTVNRFEKASNVTVYCKQKFQVHNDGECIGRSIATSSNESQVDDLLKHTKRSRFGNFAAH